MLGSAILEVAIGIAFIYLLVSTICTAVREGIETWLKSRAAYLEYGLRELLNDPSGTGLVSSLYNHPLIHGLFVGPYEPLPEVKDPPTFAKSRHKPSYIPARSFAIALMDIAARGPQTDAVSSDPASPPLSVESIRANILNLQNPMVQRVLLNALDTARGDFDTARANVEAWFDSSMDRVSGWYKRSTQWIVLIIALVMTILLNIDTIRIAQFLYQDDAARSALVARAEAATNDPDRTYDEVKAELATLALPIGWDMEALQGGEALIEGQEPTDPRLVWFTRILGWLLTAFAATLGAPFWFDMLNKVMVIRSTVKPHEKSPEEASEDRQKPSEPRTVPAAPAVASSGNGASAAGTASGAPAARTYSPPALDSALRDSDSSIDACDIEMDDETPDDQLPGAKWETKVN